MAKSERITPSIWSDTQAREAVELYTRALKGSKVLGTTIIPDTPSGTTEIIEASLLGSGFQLMSAGPAFKPNPAISFMVSCRTRPEVDRLWEELSRGGRTLMELGPYPFSDRYGWCEDRWGVSWQPMLAGGRKVGQRITPTLMYTGRLAGRCEEAIEHYTSVFNRSSVGDIARYGPGGPDAEGTVMHAAFTLEGQGFAAMDSARPHDFTFNEAVSLVVRCDDQDEIDYYWEGLSADPAAEVCGWCKDKYGVSWQVVPSELIGMLRDKDAARAARVTQALNRMKRLDLAELRAAYGGRS